MTQDEIKDLFTSIGPIESCKLVRDKSTGQSLGYGFVNFLRTDDAEKAVQTMNGLRLQNKTIKVNRRCIAKEGRWISLLCFPQVSFARPSSESIKFSNLYISNLPSAMTQQELEHLFSDFGSIISSKILSNPKAGSAKSVGFIRFDQRAEAELAISQLNGTTPKGFTEPINVKFANTPNAAKSMVGLPLAPSYLTALPATATSVLTAVPPVRQTLNRYRYAQFVSSACSFLWDIH